MKLHVSNWPANWRRWRIQLLIALGILVGVAIYAACTLLFGTDRQPHYAPARVNAWQKVVTPQLKAAEEAGKQAGDQRAALVKAFFSERKDRARAFAEEVLSLRGKWEFVKSKLPLTDPEGHRRYLRDRFDGMVVSGSELQELIQSVVNGYVNELLGIENNLIVRIRADLSDSDLARLETSAILRTDEAFRQEYARTLQQVTAVVARDLKVQVGREAASWIGADVAANITLCLATALAERLGVSAGVLGTGAVSGVATLGIGIAAGFLVDAVLDQFLRAIGHDPAGDIANKVCQALDTFQGLLLDGDPKAVSTYRTLRKMQQDDPVELVREGCRRAADKIETGGCLGLRNELKRLRETRARLREEALKKLILEGGQS
jgi:hypothetical protein